MARVKDVYILNAFRGTNCICKQSDDKQLVYRSISLSTPLKLPEWFMNEIMCILLSALIYSRVAWKCSYSSVPPHNLLITAEMTWISGNSHRSPTKWVPAPQSPAYWSRLPQITVRMRSGVLWGFTGFFSWADLDSAGLSAWLTAGPHAYKL